jgi:hypothetical protein
MLPAEISPDPISRRYAMTNSAIRWIGVAVCSASLMTVSAGGRAPADEGLLFHLSGDRGLRADVSAGGTPEPNFASDVRVIADGASGPGIECGHTQFYSYWAPGNIYAQRGTLSFFWRSREPVGKTEFPVFRVGYADHSSWDMVWLRIDYNGKPGFDAFVTDASLARTRVSYAMPAFPAAKTWTHLALSWDETRGIRFYVNGRLVGQKDGAAIFDAALDQFGPHSRVIGPMQVQSAYNFVRGGDIDEIRIYDRMLSDDNIASLARNETPRSVPALTRTLAAPESRDEWWYRYGWNRAGDVPPALDARDVSIRKVEIHDAYDLKRWWWKGTDGIRETTWPGVYNRSRLPGRNDYFQLPDWDCYSLSGQAVTFTMPDEPWNQIEIAGSAYGGIDLVGGTTTRLFERPRGQERTFHRLASAVRGQKVRFTNVEQEMPIGEFAAYRVAQGREPGGIVRLAYRLTASAEANQPSVRPILDFIKGRFAPDERATMVALPPTAPRTVRKVPAGGGLPIVHIVVPAGFRDAPDVLGRATFSYTWTNMDAGLDGIAIDLPALAVKPTHGEYFPLNIQVKDPVWPLRNMLDVSVSVKPGEPHTLWLDTRDRILPDDKGLYLTIAGAGADFGPAVLEGAELRLIFKPRQEASAEHVVDRFTQVRDNYAQIVEERPNTRRLTLYTRFETDISDLLRVDPAHRLARQYWYDYNKEQPRPAVALARVPDGAPAWAFRQVELWRSVKRLVSWYIDNRQIENGELGGGLSDDGDFTNYWPPAAFMGADETKVKKSLLAVLEATYGQGMFTKGLSTIQADELHSYEEGIDVLGQSMLLDYGNPRLIERAMETAAAVERLTGINAAGHRHIRSAYFSGSRISEEGVWGWAKSQSYFVMHPALMLVEFNGSPRVKKWVLEVVDGLLAHRRLESNGSYSVRTTIQFSTDLDLPGQGERAWPLFWAAYRWTGDRKYLQPFLDAGPRSLSAIAGDAVNIAGLRGDWGPQLGGRAGGAAGPDTAALRHFAWQVGGDTRTLESLYASQAEAALLREYINTEGSLWIDRVNVPDADLQRARLGGVALVRNSIYPGHVVSWSFARPGADERVAILVPEATPDHVRVIAYNLDATAVQATMTAWNVEPGTWTLSQGTRADAGDAPLQRVAGRQIELERTSSVDLTFEPRMATVIELTRVSKGAAYWMRPDLGISESDVRVAGRTMTVIVHSIGAVAAPASNVTARDSAGRVLARAAVPALAAPVDLLPKTASVVLRLPARSRVEGPANADLDGGSVSIEAAPGVKEITLRNNTVRLPAGRRPSS